MVLVAKMNTAEKTGRQVNENKRLLEGEEEEEERRKGGGRKRNGSEKKKTQLHGPMFD